MNEYRKMILEGLQNRYPDCDIRIEKLHRNNGCEYDGIYAKLDKEIKYTPVISCEQYEMFLEKRIMTLDEVLDEIVQQLTSSMLVNVPTLTEFDMIKDKLCVRVINYEKNAEMLSQVPYRKFLDLAIVYHIKFSITDNVEASIMVGNHFLKVWGISAQELLDIAYHNTFCSEGVRIQSASDILLGAEKNLPLYAMVLYLSEDEENMYVVDAGMARGGSVSILMKEAFQQFAEKKGCDLYIMPASVHHLIIVLKRDDVTCNFMRCILHEANANVLRQEDVLSDHIYLYQRSTDEIVDLCA